ncbi:MAG: JmjC domain-containing histone demethylation protein 1 [Cirrosporium novae-zelandiae]|nr:MAG: JmjC domain-containing histone demethylation protein 1 [Cirrosporium novae-zelandiae]
MTSTRFRLSLELPQPRPRTPSPPRDAIEPITPTFAHYPSTSANSDSYINRGRYPLEQSSYNINWGTVKYNETPHSRVSPPIQLSNGKQNGSDSAMDTFASIALATSPQARSQIFPEPRPVLAVLSQYPSYPDNDERPAKRPRSEKFPSPELPPPESRPATSHASVTIPTEDAELLLHLFSRPRNSSWSQGESQVIYSGRDSGAQSKLHALDTIPDEQNPTPTATTEPVQPTTIITESHKSASSSISNDQKTPPTIDDTSKESKLPPNLNDDSKVADDASKIIKLSSSPIRLKSAIEPSKMPPSSPQADKAIIAETSTKHAPTEAIQDPPTNQTSEPLMESINMQGGSQSTQTTCAKCNEAGAMLEGDSEMTSWISCDGCKRWFHASCVGFSNERDVRSVDKFSCEECTPIYGPTTFVRKSSRARTAIDYAGLNQGVVKSSDEYPEHHYIKPIKDGTIKFLPDNFPRMRPELVTAEYFEKGMGMTEPVCVPASMNPRPIPSWISDLEDLEDAPDLMDYSYESEPQQEPSEEVSTDDFEYEPAIDCGQDALDMVIPQGLTVRRVADLYGPDEKVEVIDVKSQQGEDKMWTMRRWAEYYENPSSKAVRNVISLEISQSKLGKLVRRPKIVRDLDLQDSVWPDELKQTGSFPRVQFYCLMSVADCYTDFHIDFGGSSVYYHIIKGKKTFFFIPPKEKHLKEYEKWCNSKEQDTTFLGDVCKECYRVDLSEGDTMLIPSGWIHAVWTPENSLVIGGNFLTRMSYDMQIRVNQIEKNTKMDKKFRYPYFQKILWYTAIKYLQDDPVPDSVREALCQGEKFPRDIPAHYEFGERINKAEPGSEGYNARYYPQVELDGLPGLIRYLLRTVLIAKGDLTEGITAETLKAVKRSIPKGIGDPLELIKTFAIWAAWKRGDELIPSWAHPENSPDVAQDAPTEKKLSARALRELDRKAGIDTCRAAPERQSARMQSQAQQKPAPPPTSESTLQPGFRSTPKTSKLGPKRVACDFCRKRRMKCKHRNDQGFNPPNTPTGINKANDSKVDISHPQSLNQTGVSPSTTTNHTDTNHTQPTTGTTAPALSPESFFASRKGRTKACDDCRKSKRRCIHDENGNVDPAKAQEPPKPRGSIIPKRRSSNNLDPALEPAKKKIKEEYRSSDHSGFQSTSSAVQETDGDINETNGVVASDITSLQQQLQEHANARSTSPMEQNAATDTVQPIFNAAEKDMSDQQSISHAESSKPSHTIPNNELLTNRFKPSPNLTDPSSAMQPVELASPSAAGGAITEGKSATPPHPIGPLASPPESLLNDVEELNEETSPLGDNARTVQTPATTSSSSRHSSRQPKQAERYVPEEFPASSSKRERSSPTISKSAKQSPSSGASNRHVLPYAIGAGASTSKSTSGGSRRASSSARSRSTVSPGAKSVGAASGMSHHKARNRMSLDENFADLETLKLLEELKKGEFGLRRRG